MTFKDLKNIISGHKNDQTPRTQQSPEEQQQEREILEAKAAIETLREKHDKAYEKRKAEWEHEHPGKDFYQRGEEDDIKDCTLDEWYWNFFQRIHVTKSPEIRYKLERNPDHGFGHKSKLHGLDDECIHGCRYYEPAGRLTVFDILEDYRGYQQFTEVLQAYKELEKEGTVTTE